MICYGRAAGLAQIGRCAGAYLTISSQLAIPHERRAPWVVRPVVSSRKVCALCVPAGACLLANPRANWAVSSCPVI